MRAVDDDLFDGWVIEQRLERAEPEDLVDQPVCEALRIGQRGFSDRGSAVVGGIDEAAHDLPPSDPAREALQMERLDQLAKAADLEPEFAKKFLTFIISEVIRHHEKLQK